MTLMSAAALADRPIRSRRGNDTNHTAPGIFTELEPFILHPAKDNHWCVF